MKLDITKEWFEKRAAAEGDHEIGAGGNRKTMTLNLTEEEIAELERLVNPNRDAIRAEAFEEAARRCEAIADRHVQAPESGAWERAERHTAKRLAAEMRALAGNPARQTKLRGTE